MKSVLISIQPKWCEKIANGEKTIEVRKTKPKLEPPFKCYIYCTLSGNNEFFKETLNGDVAAWNRGKWADKKGNVIGEFICDRIFLWNQDVHDDDTITLEEASQLARLDENELLKYADGYFYGWHISKLFIYDEPKKLSEFNHCGVNYHFNPPITRPPQSWCYVEDGDTDV